MDSLGRTLYPEDDVYPSEGLPLTPDGIVLNRKQSKSGNRSAERRGADESVVSVRRLLAEKRVRL